MKVPEPRKLPSGKWFIQLRLGGKSIPVTASTKKECTRSAELIKAEYRAGKRTMECEKTPSLYDAMTVYIDNRRNVLSPSTIRGYTDIRENHYADYIRKPIDKINFQAMVNTDAARHKPKTVKNGWRFVCSVLRENNILPPGNIVLPQLVQKQRAYLEPDQVKTFLAAVHGLPCEIAALLGLHSLRRSEILALTWDDVDLIHRLIHVRGAAVYDEGNHLIQKETTKNVSSRRTVPIMIPALHDALAGIPLKDRNGAVVTIAANTMCRQVNRACRNAGLPEVGIHGLRHSFASLAFSADVGMTEREVMEIGGWADSQTVHKIYEHLAQKNRLKASNRMAQFFQNANENANES